MAAIHDDPFRVYYAIETYKTRPHADIFSLNESQLVWHPLNQLDLAIPLHAYDATMLNPATSECRKPKSFTINVESSNPVANLFEDDRAVRILYLPMMNTYHLVQGQPGKRDHTH